MSDPISLRGIPPEVMRLAQHLSVQTGVAVIDVLRLALASGILVELTKVTPDHTGTYGGLDGDTLARALRRHLGSAIDLLLEHGQHPYQGLLDHTPEGTKSLPAPRSAAPSEKSKETAQVDAALGDDMESLGLGWGLSESTP